ncbi:sulfatase family protein [Halobellus rufus]|uniref:sulfatase family protein n=1 Tax=Halobellus rufus TaxID=1448860 RepID=UPI000679D06A|nr:sulfatase-like hydrolase/transferase [Halobellus rufus]
MRILVIDCDSLRPDHLGCYGYHRDTSPTIDSLAENGRRFTNYYVSDAPCLPSRTAFFGSRFGIHSGVINHGGVNAELRQRGHRRNTNTSTDGYRSLPTALRDVGHETALISPFPQRHGAWHTVDGFDRWIDTGERGFESADVTYPFAESWLDDHATEDDWYLHVNFWDPHAPYDTPIEYGYPFEDEPAPEWPDQETLEEQYESYGLHSAREPPVWDDSLPRQPSEIGTREEYVEWIDGYDTGIKYMDDYIEKLLDQLRAAGVFEETLVVVTADHGENQGELNVYGNHVTADDKTNRIPLIVHGPGVAEGVDDDFYYHLDLPPTLVDLAGGEVPERWDGRSFAESVTDGESDGREYLVVGQGALSAMRAVRWDDWILLRTYHDGIRELDPVELYDLAEDPHETTNLARDRPDVVRKGLAMLDQWVSERLMEVAHDRNGANPEHERAPADPLWEVLHEGGPFQGRTGTRWFDAEEYAETLRETGRDEHAERVLEYEGYVPQDVEGYLDGEDIWS